jgi:hypothetical protein
LTRFQYAVSLLPIHLRGPHRSACRARRISLAFILGNSLNMAEVATEVKLFNKWYVSAGPLQEVARRLGCLFPAARQLSDPWERRSVRPTTATATSRTAMDSRGDACNGSKYRQQRLTHSGWQ